MDRKWTIDRVIARVLGGDLYLITTAVASGQQGCGEPGRLRRPFLRFSTEGKRRQRRKTAPRILLMS